MADEPLRDDRDVADRLLLAVPVTSHLPSACSFGHPAVDLAVEVLDDLRRGASATASADVTFVPFFSTSGSGRYG